MNGRNVSFVQNDNLCISCGICYAICPQKAINIITNDREGYKFVVNESKCKKCGLCLKCCPSYDLSPYFKGKKEEKSCEWGYIKRIFLGYSNDKKIRYYSSSGGIVSQLLIFALEKKMINGAILTYMSKKDPLRTEIKIARTKEDILSARGSKYNISPVGIKIKEIMKEKGKFAIVGLPCHILAFKKVAKYNEKISKKIALYIGLFCSHTLYPEATKFLLTKEGITIRKLESISYRGNGWPGWMKVSTKGGRKKILFTKLLLGNIFFFIFLYSNKMLVM